MKHPKRYPKARRQRKNKPKIPCRTCEVPFYQEKPEVLHCPECRANNRFTGGKSMMAAYSQALNHMWNTRQQ